MITLVGAADAGGFEPSATVALPEGVADGDRLVMLATANDFPEITSMPPGWSVLTEDIIGDDIATWVFTRTADSEPADYTVQWAGEHWHFLNLIALRGAEGIRSYDVTSGDSTASLDLPPLDAQAGDALVAFGFNWNETNKAWASPLVEITNLPQAIISAWEADLAEGPTGAYTLTADASGHMAATAILVAPAEEPESGIAIPTRLRVELQLTPGVWTGVSDDVHTQRIRISRGRRNEASTAGAATCRLRLRNEDGRYTPRTPSSPHYGLLGRNTPLRLGVVAEDGEVAWRFAGEVSEWPVRWDSSEVDVSVPVTAAGPLRRLNQGEPPERDAVRRAVTQGGPLAYWPLTQDGVLRVVPPGIDGGFDMRVLTTAGAVDLRTTQLDWRAGDLAPHLDPVARTRHGGISATGPVAAGSDSGWSVDLMRAGGTGVDRIVIYTRPGSGGVSQEWRLRFHGGDGDLRVFVRELVDDEPLADYTELDDFLDPRPFAGPAHHYRLRVTPSGGGEADWGVFIDGELLGAGTTSGLAPPPAADSAQYRWNVDEDADEEHAAVGHIAVWDEGSDPPPPDALDITRALGGHTGERAGMRIRRICDEEGIALRVSGDLEDTPPIGPQYPEGPLQILRSAELVDGGVLHEARDEVALAYRTNRSRYITGEGDA